MRCACSRASSIVSTGPLRPRRDRHAGLLGHQLGLDLVAQRAHDVAGRADEDEAHLLDHVHERGMLGDEAPAGPDRVGLGLDQGLLEALVVQVRAGALAVGVDRRGRAETQASSAWRTNIALRSGSV